MDFWNVIRNGDMEIEWTPLIPGNLHVSITPMGD